MGGVDLAWSWAELQGTPVYVRRFCWDLKQIKQRCINQRAERAHGRQ
jgi:hypothetical protein